MGTPTLLSRLVNIPQNGEELQNPIYSRNPPTKAQNQKYQSSKILKFSKADKYFIITAYDIQMC